MPEDIDLDAKDSKGEADPSDSKGGKSVDYEAKYRGLSRKFSKLQAEHEKLQDLYDDAQTSVEEAKSQVRSGNKELEKEAKQLKIDLEAAQTSVAKWEKQVKAFESEKTARKTLSEKYPQLIELHDSGDLKSPDQFEKPEDYDAYLARLAAKVGPAKQVAQTTTEQTEEEDDGLPNAQEEWLKQRQNYLGATPSVSLASRDGSKVRSVNEITDEMMNLDPGKDYEKNYLALENEMNAALKSRAPKL